MRSRIHSWTETLTKLGFSNKRCKNRAKHASSKRLRVEGLEDRRMLATMVDIVFLADESDSADGGEVRSWIPEIAQALQTEFNSPGVAIDARYGLVGFAESDLPPVGHSQLINGALFSSVGNVSQLATAADQLQDDGYNEDGWDAIEHAIAEYDIRPGAVVLYVLIQPIDARAFPANDSLTHDGVLAALKSKNGLLNSVVGVAFDTAIAPRVLGVDDPNGDGDGNSNTHTAYYQVGNTPGFATSTFNEALHDVNGWGGEVDESAVERAYARLAWESGGASWNAAAIDPYAAVGPPVPVEEQANLQAAFNDAFVESIVAQIERADAAGQVFREFPAVVEINNGGGALSSYDADQGSVSPFFGFTNVQSSAATIDTETNALPANAMAGLFQTARNGAQDILQIRGPNGFEPGFNAYVGSNKSILFTPNGSVGAPAYSVAAVPFDPMDFEDLSDIGAPSIFANESTNYPSPDDIFFAARPDGENFQFPFYGVNYDSLFVDVNGKITFEAVGDSFYSSGLEGAPPDDPAIAVLHQDFFLPSAPENGPFLGHVFWDVLDIGQADERVVIQWDEVDYSFDFTDELVTFQAVLYGDGRIQMNYVDLTAGGNYNEGGNATVGLASRSAADLRGIFDETIIPDGNYVVEMFFAEIDPTVTGPNQRKFDVMLEGLTMLEGYDIYDDYAKVSLTATERNAVQAGLNTAIVKRFAVEVTDGNGLQIDLVSTTSMSPLISGLRVLMTDCNPDFDSDGDVDGRDFIIWQRGFGTIDAAHSDGDADFDGDVDADDLACWQEHYGAGIASISGNFDSNSVVDENDLAILVNNFGMTSGATLADGDADGDGDVDDADYISWHVDYANEIGNDDWIDNALNFDPDDLANHQIIVTNPTDDNDGNYSLGDLSLREALALAAMTTGPEIDTIVFANHATDAGTLMLDYGQLEITTNVEILGPGADEFAISGKDLTRVFKITDGSALTSLNVSISGLTIKEGKVTNSTPDSVHGAGIYNTENLTLDGVKVVDNHALHSGRGGGLYSGGGNLTIVSSTFDLNDAHTGGGARVNLGSSNTVTIRDSTFSNNEATGSSGGGLLMEGTGDALITNSTFSDNNAWTYGGGIRVNSDVDVVLVNSTIHKNHATTREGGVSSQGTSSTLVHNSIMAGNTDVDGGTSQDDATGTINSGSTYNLVGITNLSFFNNQSNGNRITSDAMLAPLGNYGGPTQTHAILNGSPAIDMGSTNKANEYSLTLDQRGRTRSIDIDGVTDGSGGYTDIGAYETGNEYVLLVTTPSDEGNSGYEAIDLSLREALELTDLLAGRATINFDESVEHIIVGEELVIDTDLTIAGPGANILTLDGNEEDRVFFVENTVLDAVISGLTITGGNADGLGGGVYNEGRLTLDGLEIRENTATALGGGIYSTIGNSSSTLVVKNSTIAGNSANTNGGGIYIHSAIVPVVIANSTISSNSTASGDGNGIYENSGGANIVNSTISENSSYSSTGGAIRSNGAIWLANSIVAGNWNSGSGGDLSGNFSSLSRHNIIGFDSNLGNGINNDDGSGSNNWNQVGESAAIDARLSALYNWGGATRTYKLLEDSPAINWGDNDVPDDFNLLFDQRGFDRIVNELVDIGAVELAFDEF